MPKGVSGVFFVLQNAGNRLGRPLIGTQHRVNALELFHAVGNFPRVVPLQEIREDFPYIFCLSGLYGDCAFFILFVAEGKGRGDECTACHPLLDAPAEVVRDVLALLLVHHGEDGGEELAGQFRGVNALLLETHPHTQGLQLPDGLQALLGVPGKPGGGLHQNLVHPAPPAVRQQALEVIPLLCRGAGDSLVCVYVHKLPLRVCGDELCVVGVLGGEGVELIL